MECACAGASQLKLLGSLHSECFLTQSAGGSASLVCIRLLLCAGSVTLRDNLYKRDPAVHKHSPPCAEAKELAAADVPRLQKRKACIEHPGKLLMELNRHSRAQRPDQTVGRPAAMACLGGSGCRSVGVPGLLTPS